MIRIVIDVEHRKVYSEYEEHDVTLVDSALVIQEMEKIKKILLEKDFEGELQCDGITEEDENGGK